MCNTCGRTRRRLGEGSHLRASDDRFFAAMESGSSSSSEGVQAASGNAGKFLKEQPSAAAATVAVAGAWRAVPQRALGELPEDAARPVAPASEEETASVAPASEGSAGDELLEGMHERVGAAPRAREALATADGAVFDGMLERRLSKAKVADGGNADSMQFREALQSKGFGDARRRWEVFRRRFSDARRRFSDSRRRWIPPPRPCMSCRSHYWGCQTYRSCADPKCGCNSCRSHYWGCQTYNSCADPKCGCNSCSHHMFGCKTYASCKDLFCGFDFTISRRRRRGR
jgi:hypothetical protein